MCSREHDTVLIFADLQKVLLSPSLNASATYYKTKLCCYKYTIYDKTTHEAMCYMWNETATDLTAHTFGCLLYDYLVTNNRCISADKIIIYSDDCAYQNRCVQLSNILLLYVKKFNKVVYHKYLTRGHTQMEVDSVHALIERTIKRKEVYTPACYVSLVKSAKKNPPYYNVKYVDYTFFIDYSPFSFYSSIRPGRGVGASKVVDIAQLKYSSDGLFYKLDHVTAPWQPLPHRVKEIDYHQVLKKLYTQQLPITTAKGNDLQSMKPVMPSDFHSFYDTLPKQ